MTYNTEKRKEISALLKNNSDRTFTINEICTAVCDGGKGKSTVYRIISDMVKENCVRKITDSQTRHTSYQYLGKKECSHHLHLKCNTCGKLIHLDRTVSHSVEEKILCAEGFAIDEGALIFGNCTDCKTKKGGSV